MKKNATTKQQFEQDLLSYSVSAQNRPAAKASWMAYGAAASTALLASSAIEATIVYSGPQNIVLTPTLNATTGADYTSIDMDGGGNDFQFVAQAFSSTYGYGTVGRAFISTNFNGGAIATTGSLGVRRLSSGDMVGTPGSSLGTGNGFGYLANSYFGYANQFSSTGFVGVQLSSGNFGWIQVQVDASSAITILDWAYDDAGAHLLAGDTGAAMPAPEPGTMMLLGMGMLAAGASGVRTLRRRKREAGLTDHSNVAA